MALKEFDPVVLLVDRPSDGLVKGMLGAILRVYEGDSEYEVEFAGEDGEALFIGAIPASDVELGRQND